MTMRGGKRMRLVLHWIPSLTVEDDNARGKAYAISAALDPLPSVEDDCKEDGQG